jgi:hypothetical protein
MHKMLALIGELIRLQLSILYSFSSQDKTATHI